MNHDVGRNDPCPCGSGKKFKKCCLRKRKEAGGTAKSPPPQPPTWRDRFEKSYSEGKGLRFRDPQGAIQSWRKSWEELLENLPDDVRTIDKAQEFAESFPSVGQLIVDLISIWQRLLEDAPEYAEAGVEFIEEVLSRFDEESGDMRHMLQGELAAFHGKAGRMEMAEEICAGLMEEYPESGRAYITLSDLYRESKPPDLRRALEILEEAEKLSPLDLKVWDLERRIREVREEIRMEEVRESEHFIEWDEFWDAFAEVELDEKLEMARERIDNAPDFDEEWVFHLMIEELMTPAAEQRRHGDWLELLEYLRQKRPEEVVPEAGVLGAKAVEFTLAHDGAYLKPALDLLFTDPDRAGDHILSTLDFLAAYGFTDVLALLVEKWQAFCEPGALVPFAYVSWANWAALARIAAWVEEDPHQTRTVKDLRASLGEMMDTLDSKKMKVLVDHWSGPQQEVFDAQTAKGKKDAKHFAHRLAIAFSKSLVVDEGWPAFRAVVVSTTLIKFISYMAKTQKPFQDKYATSEGTKSKELRTELKELNALWKADFPYAPHPDLALGWAEALAYEDVLGQPFAAAVFLEALTRFGPWLLERGFIENPELVEKTARHLARRLPEIGDTLRRMTLSHPVVVESLERAEKGVDDYGQ